MTDELKDMTERELLVKQSVTLKKLCDTVTILTDENKKDHKVITDKVDVVVDGKVSNRLFFWVSGIIIMFIMALTGFTGLVKVDVTKNTTNIEHCLKEVK